MKTVVGVNFKPAGRVYYFDPEDLDIERGDQVIVDTARGRELGCVVYDRFDVEEEDLKSPLKPIVRKATESDIHHVNEQNKRKEESLRLCNEKIDAHGLEMKLIDVDFTFDNSKVIFYFTADGRVDFRELVKDLASTFHMRIELRQVGVRDEAKLLGGIGVCGRALCCHQWISDFHPVSIKMAKNQDIALNPSKISGICGRLMCCLHYENDIYTQLKSRMPNPGDRVRCDQGIVEVQEVMLLEQTIKGPLIEKIQAKGKKGKDINLEIFDEVEEGEILKLGYEDFTILKSRRGRRKNKDYKDRRQDNKIDSNGQDQGHDENFDVMDDEVAGDCDPHGFDECDDQGRSKGNFKRSKSQSDKS